MASRRVTAEKEHVERFGEGHPAPSSALSGKRPHRKGRRAAGHHGDTWDSEPMNSGLFLVSKSFSCALREPVLCMKHFTQLQESVTTTPNKLELFTDDLCFVVLSTNLSSCSVYLKVTVLCAVVIQLSFLVVLKVKANGPPSWGRACGCLSGPHCRRGWQENNTFSPARGLHMGRCQALLCPVSSASQGGCGPSCCQGNTVQKVKPFIFLNKQKK